MLPTGNDECKCFAQICAAVLKEKLKMCRLPEVRFAIFVDI